MFLKVFHPSHYSVHGALSLDYCILYIEVLFTSVNFTCFIACYDGQFTEINQVLKGS